MTKRIYRWRSFYLSTPRIHWRACFPPRVRNGDALNDDRPESTTTDQLRTPPGLSSSSRMLAIHGDNIVTVDLLITLIHPFKVSVILAPPTHPTLIFLFLAFPSGLIFHACTESRGIREPLNKISTSGKDSS